MNINFEIGIFHSVVLVIFFTCSCKGQSIEDEYSRQRAIMVEQQLEGRGIQNERVLEAFRIVPRHIFVPLDLRENAYNDYPLPIGYGQTISQPYIVAYMTEILSPNKQMRILEIGTGSGYQAAILSLLCKEVYTIEIVDSLARKSEKLFSEQGYSNVKLKTGDGYKGWEEYAPFDAILVTCAPANIPDPLVAQLAEGGRMIIPAGEKYDQKLYLIEKKNGKIRQTATLPVRFVPMVREDKSEY